MTTLTRTVLLGLAFATLGMANRATAQSPELARWIGANMDPSKGQATFDQNHDGRLDAILYDTDGNGRMDAIRLDKNFDGWLETIVLDSDRDGKFDHFYVDQDKDGSLEIMAVDNDRDGQPDMVAFDTQRDGVYRNWLHLGPDRSVNTALVNQSNANVMNLQMFRQLNASLSIARQVPVR